MALKEGSVLNVAPSNLLASTQVFLVSKVLEEYLALLAGFLFLPALCQEYQALMESKAAQVQLNLKHWKAVRPKESTVVRVQFGCR